MNPSFPFESYRDYRSSAILHRSLLKCMKMVRKQLPSRRILFSGVNSVRIHFSEFLLMLGLTHEQDIIMFGIMACHQKMHLMFLNWFKVKKRWFVRVHAQDSMYGRSGWDAKRPTHSYLYNLSRACALSNQCFFTLNQFKNIKCIF